VPNDRHGRTGDGHTAPLWASSLADQPRHDDVTVRVVEEEHIAPPRRPWRERPEPEPEGPGAAPPEPRRPRRRPAVRRARRAMAVLAAVVAAGLIASAVDSSGNTAILNVPSFWDTATLSCHTARIEQDERIFEVFNCHPTGERMPPAGEYGTPTTVWNSDVDRREARHNDIDIAPDGTLRGWATY